MEGLPKGSLQCESKGKSIKARATVEKEDPLGLKFCNLAKGIGKYAPKYEAMLIKQRTKADESSA